MPVAYAPGGSYGSGGASVRTAHVPGAPAVSFSEDAFVSRRGDHLGLTLARRRAALANELPQGTTLYVGFFTQMPSRIGEGGTEASVGGYARQSIASWVTVNVGASARRTNAIALTWDAFEDPATLVGWGIWDALTNGTLRAFDHLRAADNHDPVTWPISTGQLIGIPRGGIGLVL